MIAKIFGLLIAGAVALSPRAAAAGDELQQSRSPELVQDAQHKLSSAGYDPGPANGTMGPRTHAALKAFQQAKGLQASGELDQKTLAALGDASAPAPASPSSERTAEPKPQGYGPPTGTR